MMAVRWVITELRDKKQGSFFGGADDPFLEARGEKRGVRLGSLRKNNLVFCLASCV